MRPTEIEALIDEMTLEEQVSLLSGEDFWSVAAVERVGVGKLRVTDGPNGARGGGSLIGGVKSASFPVGIALGASWNTDLVEQIGAALADEVKSKGAHMLLAPTVNIHRSVTNGRNFECYSEDPLLAAELAVAYIKGLQEKGVGATIKHFAGNESEIERTTISSVIDERSLREVYLVPFEWAVKKAGTWGVMTAYNKLNGTFASEHPWLLEEVLRKQWGFSGIVMSDWFGSHSTAETVNAGLDLEMPGPTRDRGEKLIAAVEAGTVSRETIRDRVRAMLTVMDRTGAIADFAPHAEKAEDRPEHRALIRRAGAEAAVLLKNVGVLPLFGKNRIAVIGPNAKTAQIMGGGSAQLNPHYAVSPWEGLVAAAGEGRLSYAQGCTNHRFEPTAKGDYSVQYFANRTLSGDPVFSETLDEAQAFWIGRIAEGKVDPLSFSARISGSFTPEVSGTYRVGVYSAGFAKVYVDGVLVADAWSDWEKGRTYFEEGCDEVVGEAKLEAGRAHEVVVEYATKDYASLGIAAFHLGIGLPLGPEAIAEAAGVAADADVALVFIGRNGQWDTEGSDLDAIALPGAQNDLVAAVAAANRKTVVVLQTGGPVEMPWIGEVAAVLQAWYPGQEAGNAIADVLFGHADPGGRLPQSFPVTWSDNPAHSQDPMVYPGQDGEVHYREGVFVGYRHYDKHGIAPLFPFGFGLSYTDFSLSDFVVEDGRFEAEGVVEVSVRVTNTGHRAGSCVVQLYVHDHEAALPRPEKELKAFGKTTLGPGASEVMALRLDARAFAFFDPEEGCWTVEPGVFSLRLGTSSEELPLEAKIERATGLTLPA
ncbi:beta-glucosidase [Pelagibacterium xiamenense]|uniref:beta-glucosidase n=1 Tax=Pelagibacterium xiamenense TaxID=2901140 RepID=UPI001E5C613D|nr:glycoside hydrolase family 3 C-terminal domain-containing protein [Pelagibacterium xiamenense]MCD7061415.1 glycoside hydrolase family 3 C-terminal domain-containing protein [Pelagibacterium xiamenense]